MKKVMFLSFLVAGVLYAFGNQVMAQAGGQGAAEAASHLSSENSYEMVNFHNKHCFDDGDSGSDLVKVVVKRIKDSDEVKMVVSAYKKDVRVSKVLSLHPGEGVLSIRTENLKPWDDDDGIVMKKAVPLFDDTSVKTALKIKSIDELKATMDTLVNEREDVARAEFIFKKAQLIPGVKAEANPTDEDEADLAVITYDSKGGMVAKTNLRIGKDLFKVEIEGVTGKLKKGNSVVELTALDI